MSETATQEELSPEIKEELEKLETVAKKGFDIISRVKGRGLRKATIVLFLDEEMGPELGWAYDVHSPIGEFVRREREGVIGELDEAQAELEHWLSDKDSKLSKLEREAHRVKLTERIAELEAKRDEMTAELARTGLTIHLKAVPPVIRDDCYRKARLSENVTTKGVPEDKKEEVEAAGLAHLMTVMVQSVKDNQTGAVNETLDYEEAKTLMGWLPEGQMDRLDATMGKVQFTDAISRSIEVQEDFS